MIVAHDSMLSWLSSLPDDAQLSVVLQTGLRDLGALLQADTHWRRFGESELVWRELARRRWPRTWKPQGFTGWRAWVKSRLVKTAWVRGQLGWERRRAAEQRGCPAAGGAPGRALPHHGRVEIPKNDVTGRHRSARAAPRTPRGRRRRRRRRCPSLRP